MADRDVTDEFIAVATDYALEDFDNRQLEKRFEKILPRLREGRNYVNPQEYVDCIAYMLNDHEAAIASDSESFRVLGRMEIIRVRWRDESKMVTAGDIAKAAGVTRQHICTLLDSAKIPFKWVGKRKLYDFTTLEDLRDVMCK